MATLGAKNIIALSRSGLVSVEAEALAKELKDANVRFEVYTCNVGDRISLKEVFDKAKLEMPPIRGLVQAAMDLKVSGVIHLGDIHAQLFRMQLLTTSHTKTFKVQPIRKSKVLSIFRISSRKSSLTSSFYYHPVLE